MFTAAWALRSVPALAARPLGAGPWQPVSRTLLRGLRLQQLRAAPAGVELHGITPALKDSATRTVWLPSHLQVEGGAIHLKLWVFKSVSPIATHVCQHM